MRNTFDFFDDFNDGIWTKHPGNPILTRTEDWEARVICEPSVIFEDGIFKMWYMGCRTSSGYNAALGFATSKDGIVWGKHPDNPILKDPQEAIIRPTVLKHAGTYYLFASDYQWNKAAGVINRWTSQDGFNWENKTTVLKPTEPWEGHFHNTGIIVEPDGKWQMIINTDGPFGYAYSHDGLHWTKWRDPVLKGFYGGDPCLRKIGDKYYIWHSRDHKGHLRIYCAWSEDMIHWHELNHPEIGYTEPWERGVERSEVNWDRHLTDAELLEHDGRVFMYYQGAQCPFGLAVFNGTFSQLAERLAKPPLSKWAESPYGCVEHNELKISDNESNTEPLYEKTATFGDQAGYTIEFRARSYAGYRFQSAIPAPGEEGWAVKTKCCPETSRQVQAVMRYVDPNNFARFWLKDADTTCYQECIGGVLGEGVNIGANGVNDDRWHDWKIIVDGDENRLYIDGKYIGAHRSGPVFTRRADLKIGLSVYNTYASFDDVRVRKGRLPDPVAEIGPEEIAI